MCRPERVFSSPAEPTTEFLNTVIFALLYNNNIFCVAQTLCIFECFSGCVQSMNKVLAVCVSKCAAVHSKHIQGFLLAHYLVPCVSSLEVFTSVVFFTSLLLVFHWTSQDSASLCRKLFTSSTSGHFVLFWRSSLSDHKEKLL